MSRYSALKAIINQDIKSNGQGDITGAVLNQVLKDMVNSLGAYYQYGGIATPTTNPGNPDQRVFYIATIAGTYTNFDSMAVPNGISILKFDESWSLQTLDLSSYLNNVVADGVVDGTRISATTTTNDRKTPDAYSAGSVFTYYDSTNDTTYYYVALTNGTAGSSCSDPTKFFATTSSTQAVYQAMLVSSVIATKPQSFSPVQKEQAAANIGLDVVVKGDVQQSLSDIQQVQAQNNMVGKVYDAATFSGFGKKVLAKNIQTVGGVQKNVMTQAFFQDAQGDPLTNTVFVIQSDYTLTENISIPAGCTLEFDGGSISGAYTITGNKTVLSADIIKIFSSEIIISGTWDVAEAYPEWFGAKGDGITNDVASIQKTIDSFKFTRISNLYLIQSPITIHSGKTLVGLSPERTQLIVSGSGNTGIILDNKYGTISDFTIKCSKLDFEGQLILITDEHGTNDKYSIIRNLVLYYSEDCANNEYLNIGIRLYSNRTASQSNQYGLYNHLMENVDVWHCNEAFRFETESGGWINSNNIVNCRVHSCPTAIKGVSNGGIQMDYNIIGFSYQNSTRVLNSKNIFELLGNNNIIECFPWDLYFNGSGSCLGYAGNCINKISKYNTFLNSGYYVFLGTMSKTNSNVEISITTREKRRQTCFVKSVNNGIIANTSAFPIYYREKNGIYELFTKGIGYWGSVEVAAYQRFLFAGAQIQINPASVPDFENSLTEATVSVSIGDYIFDSQKKIPTWYNGERYVNASNRAPVRSYGTTAQRPTVESFIYSDLGFCYFDTTLMIPIYANLYYSGSNLRLRWVDDKGFTPALRRGTSEQRPTNLVPSLDIGFEYYDTTLNKYLYYKVIGSSVRWVTIDGFSPARTKGTTQQRPIGLHTTSEGDTGILISSDIGFCYFDTDLGIPIYATAIDNSNGNVTWRTAVGADPDNQTT